MDIRFLGAAGTVTGSRYLLTIGQTKILVDCGLFQGVKRLRLRNWEPFPVPPSEIDAVLLTHAHLDHSGYLPLLAKNGFKGPVYCTAATRDLCAILLPDSGFLQEEEARFANRHGFSKHRPALPLYSQKDAEAAMSRFVAVEWARPHAVAKAGQPRVEFEFHPAGHLFGAATILVRAEGRSIAFSGDLGRKADPLNRPPAFDLGADEVVIESTYGDRRHMADDAQARIGELVKRAAARGGALLIPCFAVGRAQLVLHYVRQLRLANAIPEIPVYLNSPMALRANEVFCRRYDESKMSLEETRAICATAIPIQSVEESIALNERKGPMIVIAASGMATGGRVVHHLKALAPDPRNVILFVGFQAGGTRGDAMTKGAKEIKIHGEYWPVRAEVAQIDSMSAHADGGEALDWLRALKRTPQRVFVTHGEPAASDELRRRIEEELGLRALVPELGESFHLDGGQNDGWDNFGSVGTKRTDGAGKLK